MPWPSDGHLRLSSLELAAGGTQLTTSICQPFFRHFGSTSRPDRHCASFQTFIVHRRLHLSTSIITRFYHVLSTQNHCGSPVEALQPSNGSICRLPTSSSMDIHGHPRTSIARSTLRSTSARHPPSRHVTPPAYVRRRPSRIFLQGITPLLTSLPVARDVR